MRAFSSVNAGSLFLFRTLSVLASVAALAVFAGCNQGAEGDRCNPSLSHDECNSGLSCQQPVACPENYCCPVSGTSSNPNCQAGCTPGGIQGLCATDPTAAACIDAGSSAPAIDSGAGGEAGEAASPVDAGSPG